MKERKNLFDAIKEVCAENDRLHEENNRLREEIIRLRDEMEAIVKDHEVECEYYCAMISERVNIDDLHVILAKYLTDNNTTEPAKICFFQFLDEIKKFIDSNKKEC